MSNQNIKVFKSQFVINLLLFVLSVVCVTSAIMVHMDMERLQSAADNSDVSIRMPGNSPGGDSTGPPPCK